MKLPSLLFFPALAATLSAAEPLRQSSEARLWLTVSGDQAPLRDIRVSTGSATPAPWEKDPAVRERHSDVIFPVRWWDWSRITVRFTPAEDGPVDLTLNGPWSAGEDGIPIRQEVLWDDISASGAIIENGGFETTTEEGPASWQAPWAPYPAVDTWPLAGSTPMTGMHLAATWHNRPLRQTIQVRAGHEVTLTLHAKAATLPGFSAPARLGADTPAHRAIARLKRGVNLGNCWEAPPGYQWGIRFTPEDIDRIADQGFDHIRVPVAWHYYLKDGNISPKLLADLEPVLRRALDRKLHVLIDWHHFNDLSHDPAAHSARFIKGWEIIARHFKSWPPALWFELLNEPCEALTTEVANPIYQHSITSIRESNPERIIVVSPGRWGSVAELDRLRLPDTDERIVVTLHCYAPFHFTHQGAGWVGLEALRGVTYPGPPETPLALPASLGGNSGVRSFIEGYNNLPRDQNPCSANEVRAFLDQAATWSQHFGRPVHLGEFGAHSAGDDASRARYLKDVRSLAEAHGIPWTLWEWKAGFGYWDPATNRPRFRASLFE